MKSVHSCFTRLALLGAAALLAACGCGSSTDDEVGQPVVVEPPADDTPPAEPPAEPPSEPPAGEDDLVVGDDPCETDEDCVPAECCHAAACVAQNNAPDCSDVMCTQECRYGTLDCGGACLCHEGRCAARLSEPPAGLPDPVQ